MNINEYNVLDIKKYKNQVFVVFENDYNTLSFFFGTETNLNKQTKNKNIKEKEFYFYTNDFNYSLKNVDKNIVIDYIGELIEFKKTAGNKITNVFFIDIFTSISKCFDKGIWTNLEDALEDISELFSNIDEEKYMKKLKGYIGEMALVYYIMNNEKISNNIEIAKSVLDSYQKSPNQKHDFVWNAKLKLEVKSTSGNLMNFMMNSNQQKHNGDTILIYGFVKYNFVQQESLGINFEKMVEEITNKLDFLESKVPNHLMLFSKKNIFSNKYIDAKNSLEVYLINANYLPTFSEYEQQKEISEIKYKFSVNDFLLNKKYNEYDEFKKLYKLINSGV